METDEQIQKEKLISELLRKAKAAGRLETAFLWGSEGLYRLERACHRSIRGNVVTRGKRCRTNMTLKPAIWMI